MPSEGSGETVLYTPVGCSVALGVWEGGLGAVCPQTQDKESSRLVRASRLAPPNNTSEFYLLRSFSYSSICICSPMLEHLNS